MALSTSFKSSEEAAVINYIEALAELEKNSLDKKLSRQEINKVSSTKQK